MNQTNKWIILILTLCCFSQTSFANTTTFQKELDDFAWSLGNQYGKSLTPNLFHDIQNFTNKHRKDYEKARTESLKKWQVSKIDTSGFQQMNSEALGEYFQELALAPLLDTNEKFSVIQHWKILNVESMTSMLSSHTIPFLRQAPLDFSARKISSLLSINYLFGVRYATISLENNVWEVWAFSHVLAYRYKWDLEQNQIKDFSVWVKEAYLDNQAKPSNWSTPELTKSLT